MKLPWSTSVVDMLPLKNEAQTLLRWWIWCDRLMWIGATVFIAVVLALWFR